MPSAPDAVLLLVGRGSLQAETEALAGTLGLNGPVRFVGTREDVPEFLTVADGYVMSSAWEGMPMVLLEAGAAGLPIVATRVGGNQEVVQEGVSGYLVPPSDDQALAAAMLRLMALPEAERRAMGARGHDHVRRSYGLGRVVDRYEAIYREVLSKKGRLDGGRVIFPSYGPAGRSGGQLVDLQVVLPWIHPSPAQRVLQLAVAVDPLAQPALLEGGPEGVRRGGRYHPEARAACLSEAQRIGKRCRVLLQVDHLGLRQIMLQHHRLVGEHDVARPDLLREPLRRTPEIESPPVPIIRDQRRSARRQHHQGDRGGYQPGGGYLPVHPRQPAEEQSGAEEKRRRGGQ